MTSPTTQANHQTLAYPFISPTSFYNVGIGTEQLRFRPEWAVLFKERDMGHSATPWFIEFDDFDEALHIYNKDREDGDKVEIAAISVGYSDAFEGEQQANAAYIVECVNSHASLVEEVETLKVKLRSATDDAEHWAGKWGQDTIRLKEEVERLRAVVTLAVSGKNLMDGVPSVTISREAYDAMLAAIGVTNA